MNSNQYTKLGRATAFISFLLGTAIFTLYLETSESQLLFVGYAYLVIAGLTNLLLLVLILKRAAKDERNKISLRRTSGLMLLNLPVMLAYVWIAMILLSTMRITVKNSMQSVVTNIKISGCGEALIEKLNAGESKTVWVDINSDCSLYIEYTSDQKVARREVVAGYITTGMGQKIDYSLGAGNEVFL